LKKINFLIESLLESSLPLFFSEVFVIFDFFKFSDSPHLEFLV
jgi:hypothetical protein